LLAIVNETMARHYWAGRSAIGGRVNLLSRWFEVIGVVADSTYEALDATGVPHVYAAITQSPDAMSAWFVVRGDGDPASLVPAVRDALITAAPDLPVVEPGLLSDRLADLLMPQRFAGTLLSLFGVAAMALAGVGIYGVTAFSVARRTREIGIRVALGAARADIVRLIVTGVLRPIGVGAAAGLAAAALAARLIAGFLQGISPLDPVAFGATAAAIIVMAIAATWVPLRRALAVDPSVALRAD
jgi:predicted lysophospholipase L1 biosynthesis ABC-type transport system permease subunit